MRGRTFPVLIFAIYIQIFCRPAYEHVSSVNQGVASHDQTYNHTCSDVPALKKGLAETITILVQG